MTAWSDTQLAYLGKIVVTFSDLEFYADFMLVGFLSPGTGHLMTAGESITWKLDKLSVIACEMLEDGDTKKALTEWIEGTRLVTARRNQLMHSVYVDREGYSPVSRLKATTRGGRWKAHSEPVNESDLKEFSEMMDEGVSAAHDLVQALIQSPLWQGHGSP